MDRTPGTAPVTHDADALGPLPGSRPGEPRDIDTLLTLLDRIEVESWQGPTARALLAYLRETIVRPLVVELGVRGGASSQAEATAWQEVWFALTRPALRTAESPWGVLWMTARRAVLTEVLTACYPTEPRRAWKVATGGLGPNPGPVIGLSADRWAGMVDDTDTQPLERRPAVLAAVDALVSVGWERDLAVRIVVDVLTDEPSPRSTRWAAQAVQSSGYGWRQMASRLDLPAWQARRLVLVLRGSEERPGLLPRLILGGKPLPLDRAMRAALTSTLRRSRPSPVLPLADDSVTAHLRAG